MLLINKSYKLQLQTSDPVSFKFPRAHFLSESKGTPEHCSPKSYPPKEPLGDMDWRAHTYPLFPPAPISDSLHISGAEKPKENPFFPNFFNHLQPLKLNLSPQSAHQGQFGGFGGIPYAQTPPKTLEDQSKLSEASERWSHWSTSDEGSGATEAANKQRKSGFGIFISDIEFVHFHVNN